jgi:myo-inositol-1(or 4)-monophosphatase
LPARDGDLADLRLLENAAREAGAIALRYYGGDYKRWSKNRGEPVTEADLAVDRFLREAFESARADYGWLSEETGANAARQSADRCFIVDPIDGTTAFLKKKPHFAISVAVAERGRSVAGVVYNPVLDEMFAAAEGAGAHLNGSAIAVHDPGEIEGSRMLAAKAILEHPGWSVAPLTPWPQMQVESRSSIAYRMGLVACGRFDSAIFFTPKHDWDVAAGEIVIREAGGVVTTLEGDALRFDGPAAVQRSMVCAGPRLHALLLQKVKHAGLLDRRGTL